MTCSWRYIAAMPGHTTGPEAHRSTEPAHDTEIMTEHHDRERT